MPELPKPEFYPEHRRFIDPTSGELFVLGNPIVKGGIVERERIHVIDDQKNRVSITAIEDIVVDPETGECFDRKGKAIIDPSIPSDFPSKKVYCQLDGTYTGRGNSMFRLAMLKQFALFERMSGDVQKEVLKHVPFDTLLQARLANRVINKIVNVFLGNFLELVDINGKENKNMGFDVMIKMYKGGELFSLREQKVLREYDNDWMHYKDNAKWCGFCKAINEGTTLDPKYASNLKFYLNTKIRKKLITSAELKDINLSLPVMAGKIASGEWIVLPFPEFKQ